MPPLDAWEGSKTTLHLYAQMLGKVRMWAHPKLNHWWHVTLYPSVRGLTTGLVPGPRGGFELGLDLLEHRLLARATSGGEAGFELPGLSVAAFHARLMRALDAVGVAAPAPRWPYDMGARPAFADDVAQDAYDPEAVTAYWRALVWAAGVFETFRGRFAGKSTPVQLYWHSLDLALTRFSGRRAPTGGRNPVDAEAYSHEVISFGLWPGDARTREAMFYGYTAPEPPGLAEAGLAPAAAWWQDLGGSRMALVPYAAIGGEERPQEALLAFLEAAYRAGGAAAGWDMEGLRCDFV